MIISDVNTSFCVDQSPKEVFNAINNVRGWWSENLVGSTDHLNDVFRYQYKDAHKCTIQIVELIAYKKVVWLMLDNFFNFTKDKTELTGTKIEFEITEKENKTELSFMHRGLVQVCECFDICSAAWNTFINKSLHDLITKGKGQPNPKEEVAS